MDMTKLKVLVVDDMSTMRKMVIQQLRTLGITAIAEAADGQLAWDLLSLQAARFDLIVSDWNMPNMRGIDLLRSCRGSPRHAGIPFLMVTAESDPAQQQEALAAGSDGYLMKPFTPASLKAKVEEVLAKRAAPAA
jgi:two-component system, chemotaxis family, chemotaxis protein CheY